MKSLSKKHKIVLLFCSVVFVVAIALIVRTLNSTSSGRRQVKSYDPNGICLAVNNPECGYCPGEVVDNKCFVEKDQLQQYP